MIQVPSNPGQLIFDEVAMRMCPLMPTRTFADYCKKRNLRVDRRLLHRYEELGVFRPLIRVVKPQGDEAALFFDGTSTESDFRAGRAIDTSAPDAEYVVPDLEDRQNEAFYSRFQIMSLRQILQQLTLIIHLDDNIKSADWNDTIHPLHDRTNRSIEHFRKDAYLQAIPILCQLISNRYYPNAIGDQRSISVGPTAQIGGWISFDSFDWSWLDLLRDWDPKRLIAPFSINEMSLTRAYEHLAVTLRSMDPLWEWADLKQFINQRKRDQLQGDALCAEVYRQCALMIGLLNRDLFGNSLTAHRESSNWSHNHIPNSSTLADNRENLRYVVNQYDLNPQATAVLMLEGRTEVVFVESFFRSVFGAHQSNYGIEVRDLGGVATATGQKRMDRYGAILRLADYLLQHQTICFVVLDREGNAEKLETASRKKHSFFGTRKRAIPEGHLHVWDKSFEFDNFDDYEIAQAMSGLADDSSFLPAEISEIRSREVSGGLAALYIRRVGRNLPKPKLGEKLAAIAVKSERSAEPKPRPIIELLDRVATSAARNPLPASEEAWMRNQRYWDTV